MQSRIEETVLVHSRTVYSRFRQDIFESWDYKCAYCGEHAESLDHVLPKMKGGLTVAKNLVPACLPCNRKKGHREVFSWWREQPYWSEIGRDKLIDWLVREA
jgi:5-methylcytosine-specific restriction endonuclease McrA